MSGKKLVFVTGVTGYVGCHLAATLLKQGHRVVALVRESGRRRSAQERVLAAIEQVDANLQDCLDNLVVIAGDVQETADVLLHKIRTHVGHERIDEIWHCAATFLFRKRDRADVEAINIEGVRHILELVLRVNGGKQPPRYFHVGTAYSTGQELDIVPEAYVPGNTGFRSLYEWSKYEGETLVQAYQAEHGLDATIFRPAIIVGSRETKAVSHSAYYQVCDALYRLRKHFEKRGQGFDGTFDVRLMGHPQTRLNFVPIDFVIDAMQLVAEEAVLATPELKVFNIVNEDPPLIATIHRIVCQSLAIRGLEMVEEEAFATEPMNAVERLLARSVAFQAPYMVRDIEFATERFREIVPFEKLPIPQVDEEFLSIINQAYFDYLDSVEENGRREGGK
ncbi:MAG: SDR family oxidoreductase [Ardenticatenaceae bacterium]|nr:SDR family oxidoreductase [Ardenticatenaceae bacterium]